MRCKASSLKFTIAVLIITILSFCDGGREKNYNENKLEELNILTPYCSLDRVDKKECKSQIGKRVLNCKLSCRKVNAVNKTKCVFGYEDFADFNDCFNDKYPTKFPTPSNLTKIAKVINEKNNLNELDFEIIKEILNDTSYQINKTGYKLPFFNVVNNLINRKQLTGQQYGFDDKIVKSVERFTIDSVKENKSFSLNMSNIEIKVIKPKISNSNHYNISVDGILVKIPKDILKKSILTILQTNLFPRNKVESKIIDLKITDVKGVLKNPISIYFQVNPLIEVECVFWKIDENVDWSNKDVKTTRINDNLIRCQTNRLGTFALLKVSNDFCPEENTYGKINQTWCKTPVGRTALPCKNPCVNNNNKPVHRKCERVNRVPKWLKIESECSDNGLSPLTNFTNDVKIDQITPNNLTDIAKIIKTNSSSLNVIDVDQIAEILNYTSNQYKKSEFVKPFFDTVNNLLNVDQSVFKSAKEFGSTDKTLKFIDKFTTDLSKENNSLFINTPNVEIRIIQPNSTFDSYNINLEKKLIKIPNDILNTSTLTIFKNNNLFPEGNVKSEIIDLKITGVEGNLINPISIYLEVDSCENYECSFWDFNDKKIGNWSTKGVKTIRINDTHVECQTNHLTAFVFLGISDRIKLSTTNQLSLHIITTILCSLSLIGLIVVFITCFVVKKWYVKRINTIQLSSVITLEIFMLFLNDVLIIDGLWCVYFGILMHYLVLVKFMIMLIIAKMQYENYVSIFKSRYKFEQSYYITFVTFSLPILIVGISAGIYSERYNSNNVQFCYPKGEAFKYFLIIPLILILLANVIIFSLVMFKISKSISRNTKQKILQVKLAVMLFFTLGLTWMFSFFSLIICTRWLQLIFIYLFSILSPLQGFAIFVFTIILDVDAKKFWLDFCREFKYSPLNMEISTTTTSTSIFYVTSNTSQNETVENETIQTSNTNNELDEEEDQGRIRRYLRRFGWKYF